MSDTIKAAETEVAAVKGVIKASIEADTAAAKASAAETQGFLRRNIWVVVGIAAALALVVAIRVLL